MSRNIEIKARYPDLADARTIAGKIEAELHEHLFQRDTYFHCRWGRLKLRHRRPAATGQGGCNHDVCEPEHGSYELIGYHRPDTTAARTSDYNRILLTEGDKARQLLASTLGVVVEVLKERTVYLWQNVRIHLDEVDRLGSFVEFEAIVDAACSQEQAREKVSFLIEAFAIEAEQIVEVSYADLLQP